MRLVDLTRLLDPEDVERHGLAMPAARNLAPKIHYIAPDGEGVDVVCARYGCTQHDLPDGEGWGSEDIQLSTHTGTHVDAPLHYGTRCEGQKARTITDIDLNELYVDAIVLDLRGMVTPVEGIETDVLKTALAKNGAEVTPGSAILLRTGQEAYDLGDPEFFRYPGMTREGTLFLAGLGAKILGTDALGWDRPIPLMAQVFKRTGDKSVIWDGHYAGREREVFIIQQMDNLAALPPSGFKVAFFPMKLARCSAAPARVVAFLP